MRFGADRLIVNEIFGPTLQGEGVSAGRTAVFLRLAYCNLKCTFCDTTYSWDWTRYDIRDEAELMRVDTIAARLTDLSSTQLLVVTAGEPLLQAPGLVGLLRKLDGHREVEVETSGTVVPHEDLWSLVARFNVSPKLSGSGMTAGRALRDQPIAAFAERPGVVWKFVVATKDDLAEVREVVDRFQLANVFLMAEGVTLEAQIEGMRALAPICVENNWSLSPRMHVQLWGDTRSV